MVETGVGEWPTRCVYGTVRTVQLELQLMVRLCETLFWKKEDPFELSFFSLAKRCDRRKGRERGESAERLQYEACVRLGRVEAVRLLGGALLVSLSRNEAAARVQSAAPFSERRN